LVYKLCLLGLTDAQMASIFDVSEQTLNAWKKKHPDFLESIKKGKGIADADVAVSLRDRALGYTHSEEKLFQYEGSVIRAETTKHYPPDTAAAFIWLKNRQPELWKDRKQDDPPDEGPPPQRVEIVMVDGRKDEQTKD
jgi:hypothetical protein